MRVGIIGPAYTGKTTLFNAITGAGMPTGQGGVEPHRAMGIVPDQRLDFLASIYRPRRTTHVQIEWVDVPGFAPGSDFEAQREAARFLEHARRMDALVQVVRCFDGGFGDPDPLGEMTTVALELILADLQVVERRLERIRKDRQLKGRLDATLEFALLERFHEQLESERSLRELTLTPDERRLVSGFSFLTLCPLILVLNHAEGQPFSASIVDRARAFGAGTVELCAMVEAELSCLDAVERPEYLAVLGLVEPAANRMIRAAYLALDLISFFTVGADECRSWSISKGSSARTAAGAIHSDMERGFIRAEVCSFDDLHEFGSHAAAKAAGKVRLEGKAYEVLDGDIIEIRFCV